MFYGGKCTNQQTTFNNKKMNAIKKTVSLFILIFMLCAFSVQGQWDEGVAAVKCDVHPAIQEMVYDHLSAIFVGNLPAFKATFNQKEINTKTLSGYFKAARNSSYINQKTADKFKASSTLGFNIGMPPTANFVLVIVPVLGPIPRSARLPYDMLGISAELGAGLKKQGVKTESSMAFLVNKSVLVLGDGNALKKLLK